VQSADIFLTGNPELPSSSQVAQAPQLNLSPQGAQESADIDFFEDCGGYSRRQASQGDKHLDSERTGTSRYFYVLSMSNSHLLCKAPKSRSLHLLEASKSRSLHLLEAPKVQVDTSTFYLCLIHICYARHPRAGASICSRRPRAGACIYSRHPRAGAYIIGESPAIRTCAYSFPRRYLFRQCVYRYKSKSMRFLLCLTFAFFLQISQCLMKKSLQIMIIRLHQKRYAAKHSNVFHFIYLHPDFCSHERTSRDQPTPLKSPSARNGLSGHACRIAQR
jgi:hypothetical protein